MIRSLLLLLTACVLTSCVKTATIRPTPPAPDLSARTDVWRTHFIDIGQGLAVLLEFPCGAALIDTGGENDSHMDSDLALKTYLDAFFARRQDLHRTLDLLVLTHPHIDHTHGVGTVLENYKVTHAIDNGMDQGSGGAAQGELHDWVAHHPETKYQAIALADISDPHGLTGDVIDPLRCHDVDPTFHALWGRVAQDPGWPGIRFGKTPFQNANNHSVVLRVTYGKASALFTGDLEEPAIRDLLKRSAGLDVLDVDIYQVGHHGSINGTIPELVQAMTPEVAVFSMGPPIWHETWSGWKYGHPRREIVTMLEAGIQRKRRAVDVLDGIQGEHFETHHLQQAIYGTGWDGTVVVEAEADGRMRVVTSGRKALSPGQVTPGAMPQTPPVPPTTRAGGGDGHGDEH